MRNAMKKACLLRAIAWLVALALGSRTGMAWAKDQAEGQANDLRYRYLSLENLPMPRGYAGFTFYFATIDDDDRVYGNICDAAFVCSAAVYEAGAVTVLRQPKKTPAPFSLSAERHQVFGGSVPDPADPSQASAAILRRGEVEFIPSPAGTVFGYVLALTSFGPLVDSFDVNGNENYFFFHRGGIAAIDLRPVVNPSFVHANSHGVLAGTDGAGRGFRLDPRTGTNTRLDPLPTEPLSWGMGINKAGDVLGYSFVYGGIERIGVWDAEGRFTTYFVEGTADVPTISNRLLFNDDNLIVITLANDGQSYIVPQPGSRLSLADITDDLPAQPSPLNYVMGMNNRGSLVGVGITGSQFLLQRLGPDRRCHDGDEGDDANADADDDGR
jgi:hypothetical protein